MLEAISGAFSHGLDGFLKGAGLFASRWIKERFKRSPKIDYDYEIKVMTVDIDIVSNDGLHAEHRQMLIGKSKRSSLDCVYVMLNPAGSASFVKAEGVSAPDDRRTRRLGGTGKTYCLNTESVISKDEMFMFKTEFALDGTFAEMREYWEESFTKPCDYFVLRIVFPTDRPPKDFQANIGEGKAGAHTMRPAAIAPKKRSLERRTMIEWIINDVKVNGYYRLDWTW